MSPTPALRRSRPQVQATAPKSSLQTSNPPATTASTTSFLILILILVALFPNLFHLIWSGPLHFLSPVHYLWHAHSRQDSFSSPQPPQRPANMGGTSWFQKQFTLPARSRGSYLITDIVLRELPEIREYKIGLLNLFIQHTSCALSLNENWDEDVRADMSDALDRIVPDEGPKGEALYRHDAEGPDDMPAHVKSALIGASVTIPIKDGRLLTGTWQGIWYLEFRAMKHSRRVVATIQGEKA